MTGTDRLNPRLVGIGVVALTLAGAGLRGWGLGEQSLWIDEAVSIVQAEAIQAHGYPRLENGTVLWDGAPMSYLMAGFFAVFGQSEAAARLPAVLAGMLVIPLVYWLGRWVLGSRSGGLLLAFLVTFHTAQIAWSRQSRAYTLLQLLIVGGYLAAVLFVRRPRAAALVTCFLCSVLAVFSHRAGYLLPVSASLLFLFASVASVRKRDGEILPKAWIRICLVAAVAFTVVVLWMPGHGSLVGTLRQAGALSGQSYGQQYIRFLYDQFGLLALLAVVGAVGCSVRREREAIALLFASVLYLYLIGWHTRYFAFRYAFPTIVPLLLFACWLPAQIWERYAAGAGRQRVLAGLSVLLLVAAAATSAEMTWIPQRHYVLGYTAPQPGWKKAYHLILQREQMIESDPLNPRTIVSVSAFPSLEHYYLGSAVGPQNYLPVSHTGYPGEVQWAAPYRTATPIHSLDELLRLDGYLVLDDLGLRMLANPEIKTYLENLTPNAIVKGEFNVFVWLLGEKP